MTTLHYNVHNLDSKNSPVLLLHGFLESTTMWEHIDFPTDCPRIEIDLPGHGKSADPKLLCDSIEQMSQSVQRVLDILEIKEYHLIGHSMGGYVALNLKKVDPRARKVMLLNSNFWADSIQKVIDRQRVAEIVRTNKSHFIYEVIPNLFVDPQAHDTAVKVLISEALNMSAEAIGKASIAMSQRENFTEFVRVHSKDFTCVQGIEDRIVLLQQMRKEIKKMTLNYFELEGVGHMAHFESKPKLNMIISEFLK